MVKPITKISFYLNNKNKRAIYAYNLIRTFISKNYPKVSIDNQRPEVVFVLGGDGLMIKAIKSFNYIHSLFFGLNLGNVGFLTSIRDSKKFLEGINKLLNGNYFVSSRNLIKVEV
ncbi:MAG TPA: hypothetical protein P5052_02530 [Candidatus Paceibacterota bacterium]|jgi:NAD+ kinase|nr:hypothetical protein [Candidatus Paceibacterota bacterium]HRZ29612.1 hypothetical protein [Candidatus Paceibacterota bacterium]